MLKVIKEMEKNIEKEIKKLMTVDVAEVYSPQRVTLEARKHGLKPGEAMDLTTGWDFRQQEHRELAEKYVEELKPLLLIGSPMCTMFSRLQTLSGWSDKKEERWVDAKEHIKFVIKLYEKQMAGGRLFLHEHPASATSWKLDEVQKVMKIVGVKVVEADQCMYGLKTRGEKGQGEVAAKKTTKFMTNSSGLAEELTKKCDKGHAHQQLMDGRANVAARYPPGLCRAICRGIIKEKKRRKGGLMPLMRVEAKT